MIDWLITKLQKAAAISLWFWGLLVYPELYCTQSTSSTQSTFLKFFRCARFSEFDSKKGVSITNVWGTGETPPFPSSRWRLELRSCINSMSLQISFLSKLLCMPFTLNRNGTIVSPSLRSLFLRAYCISRTGLDWTGLD